MKTTNELTQRVAQLENILIELDRIHNDLGLQLPTDFTIKYQQAIEKVQPNHNELMKVHEKIRQALIDSGAEEFGDVVIDKICEAAGIPPTTVYYNEE